MIHHTDNNLQKNLIASTYPFSVRISSFPSCSN